MNPTFWNSIKRGSWFSKYLLITKEWSRRSSMQLIDHWFQENRSIKSFGLILCDLLGLRKEWLLTDPSIDFGWFSSLRFDPSRSFDTVYRSAWQFLICLRSRESKRRGRDLFRCFPSFWNKWKTTMFICTPSGKIDQGHFFMKENQPNLDGWFGEGPVLPGPKQSLKSFQKIRDNPVFSRTQ